MINAYLDNKIWCCNAILYAVITKEQQQKKLPLHKPKYDTFGSCRFVGILKAVLRKWNTSNAFLTLNVFVSSQGLFNIEIE